MRLHELIRNARNAGACNIELYKVIKLGSLKDAKKHPEAAYWAYWYACNVIGGRWPEAEEIIKTSPEYAFGYASFINNLGG